MFVIFAKNVAFPRARLPRSSVITQLSCQRINNALTGVARTAAVIVKAASCRILHNAYAQDSIVGVHASSDRLSRRKFSRRCHSFRPRFIRH